jgi:hypothetical protein
LQRTARFIFSPPRLLPVAPATLSALRCHRSLCESLHHFPNCSDLWGVFGEIVLSGVSPPIPAAFRIEERVSRNLRKEDDESICGGPPRKSRTLDESHAHLIAVLLATVEGDVQAATALFGAGFRNVDNAFTAKAVTNA